MTFDDKCHLHGLILIFHSNHPPPLTLSSIFPLFPLSLPPFPQSISYNQRSFPLSSLKPLLFLLPKKDYIVSLFLCFPLFWFCFFRITANKDSAANGAGRVINFLYQNGNPLSLLTALTLLCIFTFL